MSSEKLPHEADTVAAQGIPAREERAALFEPTAVMGSNPPEVDVSRAPLVEGAATERYQDLHLLGEGGMGEVRLCLDRRIGREVAIKVLRPGTGSQSDARARFEREARVQGQLEHPSVVPVYELGVGPTGAAFFTMKRLRGKTLSEVLAARDAGDPETNAAYPLRKLVGALSSVCLGVAFAHARGVLHRDLKPANVMLGEFGEVHVLDWGLAKVAGAPEPSSGRAQPIVADCGPSDASNPSFTAMGVVMGTPGYMAPEHVAGEEVDARADVFALGAMLFDILAYEPLVPRGSSQEEILAATIRGPENRASVRAAGRDVPPELDAICARASAHRRDDRYASARALHDALEAYLEGHRDLEKRRELADRHAEAAEVAAARLVGGGTEGASDRATAMRELGAALALNPEHRGALTTLVKLLVDAPTAIPPEARAELDAARRAKERSVRRLLPVGYLFWLIATLPLAVLGLRSTAAFVVECAFILGCVASSWWGTRRPNSEWPVAATHLLTAGALIALTPYLGPLVMVPTCAMFLMTIVLTYGNPLHRKYGVALAGLSVVGPFVLELLGWIPPSYSAEGDRLVIFARMTSFPGTLMLVYWAVSNLLLFGVPALFVARARETHGVAEERLFVHAWHLRQLVPREAHGAHPTGHASTDS